MEFLYIKKSMVCIILIGIFLRHTSSEESIVKPCGPDPCRNNGVCVATGQEFFCRCRRPFSGPTCEHVEPCHPNPCHNTGTCEADGVNFICRCPEGFTGQTCATEILQSACIPNPCDNEADCQDANGTAVCECRDGFGDLYCQTDDVIPSVAELGEYSDISCMNSQNISNVNIEITNIATERQNRISSNTIRIEHVVLEKKTTQSESFTTFTCTAYTTVKNGIIEIKTGISNTKPNTMKRSINTTLESDKDTNSTLLKDDTFKSEANDTLERDTDTTNKTTEIDDIEEVSQSKLIFSKSERNNGSVFNVRCSVSYNGTEIWSGFVIENIKDNVSGNVSDDVQGNVSGSVSGNVSKKKDAEVKQKGKHFGGLPVWAWVLIGFAIVGGISAIIIFNVYKWRKEKTGDWKTSSKAIEDREDVEMKECSVPLKTDSKD